jgi:DHA1 family multidrug resistance protein-like MFS transporter
VSFAWRGALAFSVKLPWRGGAPSGSGSLLIVAFLVMAGTGMVWSVLAVYAQSLGASTAMVGAMTAAYGGARLLINVPAGVAADRYGRRRLMIAGLVVLSLGGFATMTLNGFGPLLLGLLVIGCGSSIYATAAMAAMADMSTPERRVADMASYQGANMLGIAVGPGVGGLAAAAWGYGAPFLLLGILALVAAFCLWWIVPAGARRQAVDLGGARHGWLGAGAPLLIGLGLATFGVFFARVAANWVLMPLVATETIGMSVGQVGMLLTAGAIANLTVLPMTSAATRRFGRMAVIVGSMAATLVSLALLASAHSVAMAWASAIILGAASGMAGPTLSAFAVDAAPPGRLGPAIGMLRTMSDLGVVTGPFIAGTAVDMLGWGYPGGLLVAGLVLCATSLLFWYLAARRRD